MIKMMHANLAETHTGEIILRGVVSPDTYQNIKIASYQREVLPISQIRKLEQAMKSSTVPDIELGMRGQNYKVRGELYSLHDPVFVIDGLQRITAAQRLVQAGETPPDLGATVHFSTTEEWERQRFRVLNTSRVRLSPSILLRNMKEDNPSIDMIYNLCFDRSFILNRKVCWAQRMGRGELLTGLTLVKAACSLHGFAAAGMSSASEDMVRALDSAMSKVGRTTMRTNIATYFNVIERSFGIEKIFFREHATHLRTNFLVCLARVFSSHFDFWKGEDKDVLNVDSTQVKRIAQFPIGEPFIVSLAGSSGKSRDLLTQLMRDHFNKGKSAKYHLHPREQVQAVTSGAIEDESDDAGEVEAQAT